MYMARIRNGKTKVIHATPCAERIIVNGVTELQLLECHGMQYLAACGYREAQEWLDNSGLTKTRSMGDPYELSHD